MSAGWPTASDPPVTRRMRAGLTDSSSTNRDSEIETRAHEAVERQRDAGLQPDDAERRAIELDVLLVAVMRRVVGGDGVDAAIHQAADHLVAIGGLAQRRVHLDVRVVALERLVGQHEMMRGHLARHRDVPLLARAHGAERAARAEVRDVEVPAGQARQGDVALHPDLLRLAGNAPQAEPGRHGSPRARHRRP